MKHLPIIFGCRTTHFSDAELSAIRDLNPEGMIVFDGATGQGPQALRAVIDQVRTALNFPDLPVLIDEEGGVVSRLKLPHWQNRRSAAYFGELYNRNRSEAIAAAKAHGAGIASDLRAVGGDINWVVCAPVLDIASKGTFAQVSAKIAALSQAGKHETSGQFAQRCFGSSPEVVIDLARAVMDGMKAEGVTPCIKHMPGMGDAPLDPHFGLPVVDKSLEELKNWEFLPFIELANETNWGMTAHILYPQLDPNNAATLSKTMVKHIRETIGFTGILVTDAIEMAGIWPEGFDANDLNAFNIPRPYKGTIKILTTRILEAGCNTVLHCAVNKEHLIAELDELKQSADAFCVKKI